MNPDAYSLLLGLGLGLLAGIVFFGGLYATTRLLSQSRPAALLFVVSFVLRVAVAAGGAWFVATRGDHFALLAYLLAMIGVRVVLVGRVRRADRVEDA